jgi:hypothetical protein
MRFFLTSWLTFLLQHTYQSHKVGGGMRTPNIIRIGILLGIIFLAGCAPSDSISPVPADTTQVPVSEDPSPAQPVMTNGSDLLETQCSACHSLERVKSKSATADQWKTTVDRMIGHGAQLTAEEETILIQYLAENYK